MRTTHFAASISPQVKEPVRKPFAGGQVQWPDSVIMSGIGHRGPSPHVGCFGKCRSGLRSLPAGAVAPSGESAQGHGKRAPT